MKYTFTFPTPPTLNQQITDARTNKFKSASIKTQWTDHIAIISSGEYKKQLLNASIQTVAPLQQVKLEFFWHYITINSDPDNIAAAAKYLMDGLVKAGVLIDDSLKYIQSPVVHHYLKCKKDSLKPKAKLTAYVVLHIESLN